MATDLPPASDPVNAETLDQTGCVAVIERCNKRAGGLSKYVVAGSNNPNITEARGGSPPR